MADNDGPSSIALQAGVPALSISSNSSINTEADGAEPQSIPIGPIRTEVNGVGSQDFAYSGMDVDGDDNYVNGSGSGGGEAANSGTANNNDNVDATDSKSEAGTTASGDAQTGQSDLDDTSTVDSAIEGLAMHEHSQEMVPEEAESPNSYKSRIQARHSILRAGVPAYASAQKYTFNPVYNIPQNTVQTNALAIPPCSSHLFTGGSDGYVRRYGWYASLRNLPSERYPVLQGYWENLSITAIQARGLLWNATMQEDPSRIRFGPAGVSGGTTVPVHSLVVQKDELYCLAGSAEGVINLYSVRLDEGQCRACLGITGKGHKRNTPVSALALSEGDSTLISGGWDSQVLQWDLNTGQCTREYVAHKNTVVAVVFRPPASDNIPTDLTWGRQNEQHSSALGVPRNQGLAGDASDDTAKSGQSSKAETTLPSNSSSKLLNKSGARDFEAGSSASYDPLFDDDNDGGTAGPSRMNSPTSAAMEMTNTTDSAAPSGGLNLPGLNMSDSSSGPSLATLLALGDTKAAQNASVPTPAKLPQITRPTIPSFADKTQENLAPFPPPSHHLENTDIFLSCSVDGECLVWDRTAEKGNVRRLDLPKGCPPWCVSATWSPTGNVIYVGRRNASITIYDLRTATMETLHLPTSSGKVTGIHAMRDNRHLLVSSSDTVRLYNLETRKFTIVSNMGGSSSPGSSAVSSSANGAGAPGSNVNGAGAGAAAGVNTGVPSNATLTGAAAAAAAATLVNAANGAFTTFVADPREKYLFATYGNRGLLESGREEIATFEIQVST